jgi:hypothetical protein
VKLLLDGLAVRVAPIESEGFRNQLTCLLKLAFFNVFFCGKEVRVCLV